MFQNTLLQEVKCYIFFKTLACKAMSDMLLFKFFGMPVKFIVFFKSVFTKGKISSLIDR